MSTNRAAKLINHKAVIIGISSYVLPIKKLPAVSNDIREMVKLLSSKNGKFTKESIKSLTEKSATKDAIINNLNSTLTKSKVGDTIFVYLAGHGILHEDEYFFLPYDAQVENIKDSCVHLKTIKSLFDNCKSRCVFLLLDFCHSGGIIERGKRRFKDHLPYITRELKVIKGQGKVIIAACTSSQNAIENSLTGHGLFTHALLRGLKGEAKNGGEVTISSLYDFIDRELTKSGQKPIFSGDLTGRIVLMHDSNRKENISSSVSKQIVSKSQTNITKKIASKSPQDIWIMLNDYFFIAERVQNNSEGKICIEMIAKSGEEEAQIASLERKSMISQQQIEFAVNNDAYEVEVENISSTYIGSRKKFTLNLKSVKHPSSYGMEMAVGNTSAYEIARMRAERILLNNHSPLKNNFFNDDYVTEIMIRGYIRKYEVKNCVIREIYKNHGKSSSWKIKARLRAIFILKITGTIEHIIELNLGSIRNNQIKVSFKGKRPRQYSNQEPALIEVNGSCKLL